MNVGSPSADGPWARRLLLLLFAGLLLALPIAWASTQYLGNEIDPALSYNAVDGWCEQGAFPGLGHHCFGDYTVAALTASHDFNLGGHDFQKGAFPADPNSAYTSLYPPLGQFVHVVVWIVQEGLLGNVVTFWIYLALLGLAMLAPALWVAWGRRKSPFALAVVLVMGVAALPVIAMLDRGNSAGFAIPLVLAAMVFLGRDPAWLAPAAIVGAALVRPQFIIVALALVAIGRIRHALAAVATFVVVSLMSFFFVPGGFAAGMRAWIDNVTVFRGGFGDLNSPIPANISVARTITSVGSWLSERPGPIGSFGYWVASTVPKHPFIPALLLLCLALALFVAARGRVPRSVAIVVPVALAVMSPTAVPGYYLGFALVIAALVVGPDLRARGGRGMLDTEADGRTPWWWGWPLIVATALSIAPIALSGDAPEGSPLPRSGYVLEQIGKVWFVVVLLGLAWVAMRIWRTWRARPSVRQPAP